MYDDILVHEHDDEMVEVMLFAATHTDEDEVELQISDYDELHYIIELS